MLVWPAIVLLHVYNTHQVFYVEIRVCLNPESTKLQANSSVAASQPNKRKGKKPISSKAGSKKGKAPSTTATTGTVADEEEYEVESIQAHQWVRL